MTLSPYTPEMVDQLKFNELQPGDTVEVVGMKLDVKGRPVENDIVTFTVTMSDLVECTNDRPFPHISKLWGVGIASSNPKLLTSRPADPFNWVGNEIAVKARWQVGTYEDGGSKEGRAILVTSITITRS